MKYIIRNLVVATVLCFTVLGSAPLFAQEWSTAQSKVWKNVEAYWDLWAKRDLEGFHKYVHDDYSGWFNRAPLPSTKESVMKWQTHTFQTRKVLVHQIDLVAIKIHGNVAVVHYYYSMIGTDAEGKERTRSGRWTDILIKQKGDKWVLIGDHGGPAITS